MIRLWRRNGLPFVSSCGDCDNIVVLLLELVLAFGADRVECWLVAC